MVWDVAARVGVTAALVGRDFFQGACLRAPVQEIGRSNGELRPTLSRVAFINAHQLFRLRIGQRPQQYRADHRENCGVGADAERQRQHDDGCEPRRLAQHPQRIADILIKVGEHVPSPAFAEILFLHGGLPVLRNALDNDFSDRLFGAADFTGERGPVWNLRFGARFGFSGPDASRDRIVVGLVKLQRELLNNLLLACAAQIERRQMSADVQAPIRHRRPAQRARSRE